MAMEPIVLPATYRQNLSGRRFGRLLAVHPVEIRKNRHVVYKCRCDCGAERFVTSSNLSSGHTQSCGCLAVERISEANGTHYQSGSKLYRRYNQMLQRCYLDSAPNYKWYGGRGIGVCKRWRDGDDEGKTGFECFVEDMGEPPPGAWIERENNDKNYEPDNCSWASPAKQARNTRRARLITWNGQTLNLSDWERVLGKNKDAIGRRLRGGWSVQRALST